MRSDDDVRRALNHCNVVINLLGAHSETWNYRFEEVHIDFAARIARLAKESGSVQRLVHVSCLGAAPDAPSRRLQTKVSGACL